MTTTDGRRARGAISRSTVLSRAVDIASVEGIEGLSIGSLALGSSLSKSGVVALFGTKVQLQLATIEAARQIFVDNVVTPALAEPGGLARVTALVEHWLRYSESRVFAGGCFFGSATMELASKPGPLRDAISAVLLEWNDCLLRTVRRAVERGELSPGLHVEQTVFEIRAVLDAANANSLVFEDAEPYNQARAAIARILAPGLA